LKPVEAFAQVLRRIRKAKNISQEELAHQSGLDRTYISLLERGLRQPSLSSILLISKSLGVSSADILKEVEAKLTQGPPERMN
jgi:transcriptional regulator with XRE-family HTH domain